MSRDTIIVNLAHVPVAMFLLWALYRKFISAKPVPAVITIPVRIIRLFLVIATFGLLAACSSGEDLAEASGPVFLLNTHQMTPPGPGPVASTKSNVERAGSAAPAANLPRGNAYRTAQTEVASNTGNHATLSSMSKPIDLTSYLVPTRFTHPTVPKAVMDRAMRPPTPIPPPARVEAVSAVMRPVPAPRLIAPPPPPPVWTLQTGTWIGKDVVEWGSRVGWTVLWQAGSDWQVPATTTYSGTFRTAASNLLNDMVKQGAPIQAVFHLGNKTLVVTNGEQP